MKSKLLHWLKVLLISVVGLLIGAVACSALVFALVITITMTARLLGVD